jgi:hypothetical protein
VKSYPYPPQSAIGLHLEFRKPQKEEVNVIPTPPS